MLAPVIFMNAVAGLTVLVRSLVCLQLPQSPASSWWSRL
ncbi:hypothetical protein AGR1B_Lc10814 [Agrobacterium fabacearum S56]|nr:hypothetical protein AGR1B_Lc10814 [Agrobacterium fabacearum S56]